MTSITKMKMSARTRFFVLIGLISITGRFAKADGLVPADFLKGVRLPHSKDEMHAMLDAAENDGAHGCGKWLWPSRPEMVEEILGGQDDEARGDSARLQCAQLAHSIAVDKKDKQTVSVLESSIDPKLFQTPSN